MDAKPNRSNRTYQSSYMNLSRKKSSIKVSRPSEATRPGGLSKSLLPDKDLLSNTSSRNDLHSRSNKSANTSPGKKNKRKKFSYLTFAERKAKTKAKGERSQTPQKTSKYLEILAKKKTKRGSVTKERQGEKKETKMKMEGEGDDKNKGENKNKGNDKNKGEENKWDDKNKGENKNKNKREDKKKGEDKKRGKDKDKEKIRIEESGESGNMIDMLKNEIQKKSKSNLLGTGDNDHIVQDALDFVKREKKPALKPFGGKPRVKPRKPRDHLNSKQISSQIEQALRPKPAQTVPCYAGEMVENKLVGDSQTESEFNQIIHPRPLSRTTLDLSSIETSYLKSESQRETTKEINKNKERCQKRTLSRPKARMTLREIRQAYKSKKGKRNKSHTKAELIQETINDSRIQQSGGSALEQSEIHIDNNGNYIVPKRIFEKISQTQKHLMKSLLPESESRPEEEHRLGYSEVQSQEVMESVKDERPIRAQFSSEENPENPFAPDHAGQPVEPLYNKNINSNLNSNFNSNLNTNQNPNINSNFNSNLNTNQNSNINSNLNTNPNSIQKSSLKSNLNSNPRRPRKRVPPKRGTDKHRGNDGKEELYGSQPIVMNNNFVNYNYYINDIRQSTFGSQTQKIPPRRKPGPRVDDKRKKNQRVKSEAGKVRGKKTGGVARLTDEEKLKYFERYKNKFGVNYKAELNRRKRGEEGVKERSKHTLISERDTGKRDLPLKVKTNRRTTVKAKTSKENFIRRNMRLIKEAKRKAENKKSKSQSQVGSRRAERVKPRTAQKKGSEAKAVVKGQVDMNVLRQRMEKDRGKREGKGDGSQGSRGTFLSRSPLTKKSGFDKEVAYKTMGSVFAKKEVKKRPRKQKYGIMNARESVKDRHRVDVEKRKRDLNLGLDLDRDQTVKAPAKVKRGLNKSGLLPKPTPGKRPRPLPKSYDPFAGERKSNKKLVLFSDLREKRRKQLEKKPDHVPDPPTISKVKSRKYRSKRAGSTKKELKAEKQENDKFLQAIADVELNLQIIETQKTEPEPILNPKKESRLYKSGARKKRAREQKAKQEVRTQGYNFYKQKQPVKVGLSKEGKKPSNKILAKTENMYGYGKKRAVKNDTMTESGEFEKQNEKKRSFYRKIGVLVEVDSKNFLSKQAETTKSRKVKGGKKMLQSARNVGKKESGPVKNFQSGGRVERPRFKARGAKERGKNKGVEGGKDKGKEKTKETASERRERIRAYKKMRFVGLKSKKKPRFSTQKIKTKGLNQSQNKDNDQVQNPLPIINDRAKTTPLNWEGLEIPSQQEPSSEIEEQKQKIMRMSRDEVNIEIQSCRIERNVEKMLFETGSAKALASEHTIEVEVGLIQSGLKFPTGLCSPSDQSHDFQSESTSRARLFEDVPSLNSRENPFDIDDLRNFHKKGKTGETGNVVEVTQSQISSVQDNFLGEQRRLTLKESSQQPPEKIKKNHSNAVLVEKRKEDFLDPKFDSAIPKITRMIQGRGGMQGSESLEFLLTDNADKPRAKMLDVAELTSDMDMIINGVDSMMLGALEYSQTRIRDDTRLTQILEGGEVTNLVEREKKEGNTEEKEEKNKEKKKEIEGELDHAQLQQLKEDLNLKADTQDMHEFLTQNKSMEVSNTHPFLAKPDRLELRSSLDKYAANLERIEEEERGDVSQLKEQALKQNEDIYEQTFKFDVTRDPGRPPQKLQTKNLTLKTLGSRDFDYSLTDLSPRQAWRKKRSRESIDKKNMNLEMDLILKSVNSLTRTNRSSVDKSPRRQSSIDLMKKNKLANSLRNSRKLYQHKAQDLEKKASEASLTLTLDLSLDQEYTMLKCPTCSMYFVQKDMASHVSECK